MHVQLDKEKNYEMLNLGGGQAYDSSSDELLFKLKSWLI
jgi:hypothetical protein